MIADVSARRKGLAREALRLMMGYAVESLAVRTFVAKIGHDNVPSRVLFRQLGFAEQARARCFERRRFVAPPGEERGGAGHRRGLERGEKGHVRRDVAEKQREVSRGVHRRTSHAARRRSASVASSAFFAGVCFQTTRNSTRARRLSFFVSRYHRSSPSASPPIPHARAVAPPSRSAVGVGQRGRLSDGDHEPAAGAHAAVRPAGFPRATARSSGVSGSAAGARLHPPRAARRGRRSLASESAPASRRRGTPRTPAWTSSSRRCARRWAFPARRTRTTAP